ncbi:hypothetical protein FAM09_07195 [Niastella caeni]|uniref:Uncharacterized protein n=1 Tax=Niastella caeni TaxID=2569763 RepID=A0A4S8I143_9BACT|nr:hypothetical protein [Niastella caeni]THU41878.1 hypothetical protein FAM09_07195 [Niastella caeni]
MNKVSSWVQQHKVLSTILALVFVSYLWYDMPFKATDPASPYFIESLFRMRDYGSASGVGQLRDNVLPKLFPVGTPKDYVDLMLVDRGGAHIIDITQYNIGGYIYSYKPVQLTFTPDDLNIRIYYDKNMKVEAVNFYGRTVVGKGYKPKKVSETLKTEGQSP